MPGLFCCRRIWRPEPETNVRHTANLASRPRPPSATRDPSFSPATTRLKSSIPSFAPERKRPCGFAKHGWQKKCTTARQRLPLCSPDARKPADRLSQHDPKDKRLRNARNNELSDRRTASADAKTALLNAYRTAKTRRSQPIWQGRRNVWPLPAPGKSVALSANG